MEKQQQQPVGIETRSAAANAIDNIKRNSGSTSPGAVWNKRRFRNAYKKISQLFTRPVDTAALEGKKGEAFIDALTRLVEADDDLHAFDAEGLQSEISGLEESVREYAATPSRLLEKIVGEFVAKAEDEGEPLHADLHAHAVKTEPWKRMEEQQREGRNRNRLEVQRLQRAKALLSERIAGGEMPKGIAKLYAAVEVERTKTDSAIKAFNEARTKLARQRDALAQAENAVAVALS